MNPWYFYVFFFILIFVLTLELLNLDKHKTQEHNQEVPWHHVKCKCGYCEDVHVPVLP